MLIPIQNSIIAVNRTRQQGWNEIAKYLMLDCEEICVLKKTYLGNNHDEDWQHEICVIRDGGVWADRMPEIAKDGHGLFWAPPLIQSYTSIENALQDWAKAENEEYVSLGDPEIYTGIRLNGKLYRRAYRIRKAYPMDPSHLHSEYDIPAGYVYGYPVLTLQEELE